MTKGDRDEKKDIPYKKEGYKKRSYLIKYKFFDHKPPLAGFVDLKMAWWSQTAWVKIVDTPDPIC